MAGFSASLKLTDMDYIAPSQACVLPLAGDGDGTVQRHAKVKRGEGPASTERKVEITLADCLACSGCVTTAETMLVQEQSVDRFLEALRRGGRPPPPPLSPAAAATDAPAQPAAAAGAGAAPAPVAAKRVVVTVAPACLASIAAAAGGSCAEALAAVRGFLVGRLRCDDVVDLNWAQSISLLETAADFLARWRARGAEGAAPLPVVTSACPGVVCYVEKTEPVLLPHLSTAQSAQAIQGRVVKEYYARKWQVAPEEIYHMSVQPCYDKKLEAARGEFSASGGARWVDLVLASHELVDLVERALPDEGRWRQLAAEGAAPPGAPRGLAELQGRELLRLPHSGEPHDPLQEGSGAYHQVVLWLAAREMYGASLQRGDFALQPPAAAPPAAAPPAPAAQEPALPRLEVRQRRPNFLEYTLRPPAGRSEAAALRFAVCYGFQNIRNLVRVTRSRPALFRQYDFIEVMACPDGCLNGGGQVRAKAEESNRQLLSRVQRLFHEMVEADAAQRPPPAELLAAASTTPGGEPVPPESLPPALTTSAVYRDLVGGGPGSAGARALFHATWQDHSKKRVDDDMRAETTPGAALATMSW
eukprot:TRINITY_DN2385_c1_g1_i1.p1 TRINITY_DN2385_c1_g1~~TRINITY_DN2385_c1_g1_i1.p1  ORF type:complete len:619 (+),score=190.68 TRINITY_DN2385_c1_g1_i1:95-1858(+)